MADKKNTIADSDQQTQEAGANPDNVGYLELAIGRSIRLPNGSFLKINQVSVAGSPVLPLVSASLRPGDEITIEAKDGGLAVFNEVMLLVKGSPVKIEPGSFKRYGGVGISFKIPTDSSNQFGEGDEVKIVLVGPSFEAEIQHKFIFFEKSEKEEENESAEKQAKAAQKRAENFQDLQGQTKTFGDILAQAQTEAVKGVIGGVTGGIFDPALAKQMNDALAGKDVSKLKSLAQTAVKKGDLKALEEAFKNATDPAHKEILRQSIESVKKQQALAKEKEQQAKKPEGDGLGNIRSKQQAASQAQSELDDDDLAAQAEILPENEQEAVGSTLAQQTIPAKNITGLGTEVSAGGTQTIGGRAVSLSGSAEVMGGAGVAQTSTTSVIGAAQVIPTQGTVTGAGQRTISQQSTAPGGGQTVVGGTTQVKGSQEISSQATVSAQGQVQTSGTVRGPQQTAVSAGDTTEAGAKVTSQGSGGGQAQVNVSGGFKQQAAGGTSKTSQQVSAGQTASGQISAQVSGGQTGEIKGQVTGQGQTGVSFGAQTSGTAKSFQGISGITTGTGGNLGTIRPTTALGAFSLRSDQSNNVSGQIPKVQSQPKPEASVEQKVEGEAVSGEKEQPKLGEEKNKAELELKEKAEIEAAETPKEKEAGMQIMDRLQAAEQNAPKNAVELNRNLERIKLREAGEESQSGADKKSRLPRKEKKALKKAEQAGVARGQNLQGSSNLTKTGRLEGGKIASSEQLGQAGQQPGAFFDISDKTKESTLPSKTPQPPQERSDDGGRESEAGKAKDSEDTSLEEPDIQQQPKLAQPTQQPSLEKELSAEEIKKLAKLVNAEINSFLMGGVGWVFGLLIPTFGLSLVVGAIAGDLLLIFKGIFRWIARSTIKKLPFIPSKVKENSEVLVNHINIGLKVKAIIILLNFVCAVITFIFLDFVIYIGCNAPVPSNPVTKYYGSYIGMAGYSEVCEKFLNISNPVFDRPASPSGPAIRGASTQEEDRKSLLKGVNAR